MRATDERQCHNTLIQYGHKKNEKYMKLLFSPHLKKVSYLIWILSQLTLEQPITREQSILSMR